LCLHLASTTAVLDLSAGRGFDSTAHCDNIMHSLTKNAADVAYAAVTGVGCGSVDPLPGAATVISSSDIARNMVVG